MTVRTRIAPSPTGDLHIGHLRTVLYDYALAKRFEGQFVYRVEDTDRERYVEGAVDRTLDVIEAFGLSWDEGPRVGGNKGPYVQSERLDIYKSYAEELVQNGHAYYCFLTQDETKKLQELFRMENKRFRSPHRELDTETVQAFLSEGKPYVIRLKVPKDVSVSFEDAVYGTVTYKSEEIDDQVLIKQDGYPTYHLAVVVDDHLMNITHILRGNDWLPSTPKHVLLYNAFGWQLPTIYAHLPNLKEKGENRKMSKRRGSVFAVQFIEEGYLPDAILNFLMFLGWSSPEERVHGEKERELYSLDEFIELFSLDRIQKVDMVAFDRDKLVWFNKEYMKMKSADEFQNVFINWLEKYKLGKENYADVINDTKLLEKLALVKDRSKTLQDSFDMIQFFYKLPKTIDWNIKPLEKLKNPKDQILKKIIAFMESFSPDASEWTHETWESGMRTIGDEMGEKHGDIFMVLRVAVVGTPFSPPLFESLQILGKDEVLKRLKEQG